MTPAIIGGTKQSILPRILIEIGKGMLVTEAF
jgi:hypothetical protein